MAGAGRFGDIVTQLLAVPTIMIVIGECLARLAADGDEVCLELKYNNVPASGATPSLASIGCRALSASCWNVEATMCCLW